MQNNNYTVYVHTTPNNKKYVGITRQGIKKRWRNGCGYDSQLFGRAITKYGWNNIKHQVLAQNLTQQEAEKLQKRYILQWETNNPNFGYNQTNGGLGGPPPPARKVICLQTKEVFNSAFQASQQCDINEHSIRTVCNYNTRKKTAGNKHWVWYDQSKQLQFYDKILQERLNNQKQIRQKARQQVNAKNRQRLAIKTPVICLNSKKIYKDITEASEDLSIPREYIRRACVGVNCSTHDYFFSFYDIDKTLDYYQSLLQNLIRKQRTKNHCISVRCIQTGVIYSSIKQASEDTKVHRDNIGRCCKGTRKSAGGYHWEYVDKEI